jgi:hypothetical protein
MIFIDLSYEFEITLSDTTQPVVCAGFSRREGGHVRILNNLIRGNNTHGPTRKTRGDTKVIVYAISKELPLAAANPISLVMALDSECLVEPSFALENADKLLEDIQRFFFLSIPKRCVSCFHIAPARSFKGFKGSRACNSHAFHSSSQPFKKPDRQIAYFPKLRLRIQFIMQAT